MNVQGQDEHTYFEEHLPFYVAGRLEGAQRTEIEAHLATCAACRADLEMWMAVSGEIGKANRAVTAPPRLAAQALERVHAPGRLSLAFRRAWQLLYTQALLVQSEMWPASAIVMAMGVITALLSARVEVIYFIAPLIAASTLATLYGSEHDPALELSLSTVTSPWKILLARMSVVSAYNLLLALAASLALLSFAPPGALGVIILGWLGPLAFLSALALLLSLWLGTNNALAIAYGLWLVQYVPFKMLGLWMASPAWNSVVTAYQQFWRSPLLLLCLAGLIVGIALWSASRLEFRLTQTGLANNAIQ